MTAVTAVVIMEAMFLITGELVFQKAVTPLPPPPGQAAELSKRGHFRF